MALYPDILFHLTTKQNLFQILDSSFKPSYAREKIKGGRVVRNFAVPMVSFSDLRLSELKDNIKTYEKFGLGMKKEWAIKKGLNPVMYVSDQSLFTKNFLNGLDIFFNLVWNGDDVTGRSQMGYNQILNTLRYMKNYKGKLERPEKPIVKNFVFANEREWRFVPKFSDDYNPILPINKIGNSTLKQQMNNEISHIHLDFTPDDIMYIIVEGDRNINELIEHLRVVKGRFDQNTIDRLTSRILTYEQIKNDI